MADKGPQGSRWWASWARGKCARSHGEQDVTFAYAVSQACAFTQKCTLCHQRQGAADCRGTALQALHCWLALGIRVGVSWHLANVITCMTANDSALLKYLKGWGVLAAVHSVSWRLTVGSWRSPRLLSVPVLSVECLSSECRGIGGLQPSPFPQVSACLLPTHPCCESASSSAGTGVDVFDGECLLSRYELPEVVGGMLGG